MPMKPKTSTFVTAAIVLALVSLIITLMIVWDRPRSEPSNEVAARTTITQLFDAYASADHETLMALIEFEDFEDQTLLTPDQLTHATASVTPTFHDVAVAVNGTTAKGYAELALGDVRRPISVTCHETTDEAWRCNSDLMATIDLIPGTMVNGDVVTEFSLYRVFPGEHDFMLDGPPSLVMTPEGVDQQTLFPRDEGITPVARLRASDLETVVTTARDYFANCDASCGWDLPWLALEPGATYEFTDWSRLDFLTKDGGVHFAHAPGRGWATNAWFAYPVTINGTGHYRDTTTNEPDYARPLTLTDAEFEFSSSLTVQAVGNGVTTDITPG